MEKTALITGGARGLGREVSLSLAARGYAVAVNYLKSGRYVSSPPTIALVARSI